MTSKATHRDRTQIGTGRARGRRSDLIKNPRITAKLATIRAYLESVPRNRREALQDLRKKILSVIPEAQECISYRMPAFRVNGAVVAGFAATTKGCSYFPFSGSTLKTLGPLVSRYDRTKSSPHFSPDHPLPLTLVNKLIKTRIAETKK